MQTRIRYLAAFLGAAALPLEAQQHATGAPAALRGPRLRIGVMDLSGSALAMQTSMVPTGVSTTVALAPPPEFSRGLTQMLTTALVDHGGFVVLERAQMTQILIEQDFTVSGRVTPETSIAIGKVLGAQILITGDITEFSYKQSSAGSTVGLLGGIGRSLGAKADRVTAQVAIDLRVLDATTGEVLGSARGEGKASATALGADLAVADKSIGLGGTVETPLGQASRRAIEKAVDELGTALRGAPWSGRVGDVRGTDIYINAGSQLGVAAGMEFDVFTQEKPVVDPESGSVLGTPEHRAGRIVITRVAEKYAVGRTVDGTGFKRNDVVRFRGASAEK
jgi:curli biogenesis system outer membrane secretion channel CsgG